MGWKEREKTIFIDNCVVYQLYELSIYMYTMKIKDEQEDKDSQVFSNPVA